MFLLALFTACIVTRLCSSGLHAPSVLYFFQEFMLLMSMVCVAGAAALPCEGVRALLQGGLGDFEAHHPGSLRCPAAHWLLTHHLLV